MRERDQDRNGVCVRETDRQRHTHTERERERDRERLRKKELEIYKEREIKRKKTFIACKQFQEWMVKLTSFWEPFYSFILSRILESEFEKLVQHNHDYNQREPTIIDLSLIS